MDLISRFLSWITDKWWRLLLFFFICISVAYLPAYHSKFTSDFLSWVSAYDKTGIKGLPDNFNDPSLKYTYHVLMFGIYRLFGFNPLGWYIIFNMMHAFNGYLLYVMLRKLLKHLSLASPYIPVLSSLFFLFSPYQTETVVWAAAIHFLFVASMILIAMISLMRYMESEGKKIFLWGIFIPFAFGLFATEAIFILPVLLGALGILLWIKGDLSFPLRKILLTVVMPAALMLSGFILLTYLKFGNPVGHYGTEKHLNIDLSLIGVNYLKYILKFLFLFRYIPLDTGSVIHYIETGFQGTFIIVILGLLAGSALVMIKKISRKTSLLCGLFFFFLIALIPVINLETPFLRDMQADRYGYIPSLFYYPLFISMVMLLPRTARKTVIILFAMLNLICLADAIRKWQFAGRLMKNLVDTFPYQAKGKVYILNMVDNYCGAYCFRHGFKESLQYRYGAGTDSIIIVATYNMYSVADSVKVAPKQNDSFEVVSCDWGRWFWVQRAHPEHYNLETDAGAFQYMLHFKDLKKEDLILYQAGKEWHYVHH